MNPVDAYRLLALELVAFRSLSYAELAQKVGQRHARRVQGGDSVGYSIEIDVRWRDRPQGAIVVEGSIEEDNGGSQQRLENSFVVPAP